MGTKLHPRGADDQWRADCPTCNPSTDDNTAPDSDPAESASACYTCTDSHTFSLHLTAQSAAPHAATHGHRIQYCRDHSDSPRPDNPGSNGSAGSEGGSGTERAIRDLAASLPVPDSAIGRITGDINTAANGNRNA